MYHILILHGPNLNLLGERETQIYGTLGLDEINENLQLEAKSLNFSLQIYQSNHEGELIDQLHEAHRIADGVVLNPGAYTHYSYAIRDAVDAIYPDVIEVHLSDIENREEFRKLSVIAPVCVDQIKGHGWKSYSIALHKMKEHLDYKKDKQ